ncbi:hypothetical protein KIH07_17265 [Hydrogenophaga taeniospiralis]|jgi:hypothetical protein|uniref:hypothetical protein n=1 Tax=Hydrogenophaga taeniospiralis TaxID=65656 RepID=UPI001CFBBB31|nr:hypothetical protein [Hydrogenophaga taeniospiralis]MCB4365494.1 hypothetical protein [Hydrogenophaga taeniospiralis]
MTKFVKSVIAVAALAASIAPTIAAAHDVWICGGKQNLAFGGKYGNSSTPHKWWTTRIHGLNQASSVWHDWTWRGKSQGLVQFCSAGSSWCTFTWSGSKTVSYTHSTGTSVGFDLAFGAQEAGKRWLQTETWSQSTTQSWAANARFAPGMWAEPVIAVARRWKQGYFAGFHVPQQQVRWDECGNNGLAWAYNWDGERRDGRWVANAAEYTFKIFHVTPDRNRL